MPIKTNNFLVGAVKGQVRSSQFASWTPYSDAGVLCTETSVSHNHARLASGRWSGGGNWDLFRDITSLAPDSTGVTKITGSSQIMGTARMGSNLAATFPMGEYHHPTDNEMDALGTTAIARTEPLNPAFDLSVFLGELRAEGLPRLPGAATREKVLSAKSAGSEYLNVEFGWSPLVRGVQQFATVVDNHDKIIRSFQENANRVLQRSYEWPEESESHAEDVSFGSVPASGGTWFGGGRFQQRRQRKWFEVEYIYYLPTGGSFNDKVRRYGAYARKLLGIDLSPEVLWNLAPWSWAADWFANTGDIMHNISALGTDGLVMRNGYVMCHTEYIVSDYGKNSLNGAGCHRVRTIERKKRRGATPYGFGLNWDGFSTKQLAIITALGLSKA